MSSNLVDGKRRRRIAKALPFILPGIGLYMVFVAIPVIYSAAMSLFDWDLARPRNSQWLGLANYIKAFGDPVFLRAVVNTIMYSIVTVPLQIVFGITAAVLLNQKVRGQTFFRVVYYLPVITNWVIVGVLFKYAFNGQAGIVNFFLRDILGLIDENILWLADPVLALVPVFLVEVWKGVGWCAIIYLAALQGVPNSLMEAARMDGAGTMRRFFSITLPFLASTTLFLVVVRTIGTLNGYVSNVVITGGGQPMDQTHFILTLMYKAAFGRLDFGYGSAISYVLTFFIVLVSVFEMKVLRNRDL